jgi:hypothetical protein
MGGQRCRFAQLVVGCVAQVAILAGFAWPALQLGQAVARYVAALRSSLAPDGQHCANHHTTTAAVSEML